MIKDRRVYFRKGLSTLYTPIYDALSAILPDEWQPTCGLRTIEEQNKLYAKGRTAPGKKVTNAKGGQSPHNYGCASDWCIFDKDGQPEWPSYKDARMRVYQQAIEKVGGRWGADWDGDGHRDPDDTDTPHNELPISVRWSKVGLILDEQGLDMARAFIAKHRK